MMSDKEKIAAQIVSKYKQENNASKGEAAIEAILTYRKLKLNPPEWALDEISKAWELYKTGRDKKMLRGDRNPADLNTVLTFDEALDLKSRTGRTAAAKQKKEHLMHCVYKELKRLHGEGYPLDDQTKAMVGKKFGISGSTVRDYYQEAVELGFQPIPEANKNS